MIEIEITKDNNSIGSTYSQSNYQDYKENSNIFEEVIDDSILDEYSKSDEEKDYIKSLPRDKKRMARLSLMSDNNVLWNKIYEIHCSIDTKYNKIKKIILLLRDYVKIADVERKSHGEILTPFNELAKPMVGLMEKYDEKFWKDPTNKVLDSSAGYGTFLILCLYKFMEGLKEVIPNEDERLKHVIEKQLYYGELQSKSVFSWLVAIDPNDEYKTNIYWGSYLEQGFDFHMKNIWKIDSFQLIIQNPPYQMQKEGFKKTQPLWHLFVQKSLTLLEKDGYMIMVHPSGWRNVDGVFKETQILLKNRQILNLCMNSVQKGEEIFGASTSFDYYLLKNEKYSINTDITDINGIKYSININKMELIPNCDIEKITSLLKRPEEKGVSVLHSYSTYETRKPYISSIQSDIFVYPCVYSILKNGTINLLYSNEDKGHFGVKKIIFGNGANPTFILDKKGEYGMTQFSFGVLIDTIEEMESFDKVIKSGKLDFITKATKFVSTNGNPVFYPKILPLLKKDFWKDYINE